MKKAGIFLITIFILASLSACAGETLSEKSKSNIDAKLTEYVDTSLGLVTEINPETDDYEIYSVTVDSDLWYAMSETDMKRVAKVLTRHISDLVQSKSQSRKYVVCTFYDSESNKIAMVDPSGEYTEK